MKRALTFFFPSLCAFCPAAIPGVKCAVRPGFIAVLFLLFSSAGYGQNTSFFQAQFNGGVTGAGYGPEYDLGGTGTILINIAPGSTIYKAWLFAGRQGAAPALTVTLNGTSLTFDNTNQVSNTFQSPSYGGPSAVHAIDVSGIVTPTNNTYTLVIPGTQTGPEDRFQDFYLYVAYANPALPQVTSCIFLNAADCQQSINDVFNMNYPIQNVNNVGVSFYFGYACDLSDGETVVVNGTTLGTTYGPNANSGYCAGPFGDFYYQNGTLFGLSDGNPDLAVNGPDAISNMQTITNNCVDSVTANFSGGATSNALWGFFFTYSAAPVSVTTDTSVCAGSPVQLNISSGGGTVSWSPTAGLSCSTCTNPIATPTTTTTYVATITGGGCGAVTTDTAIVAIASGSATVTVPDASSCSGQPVTMTATPSVGGGTYLWSPGGQTTQSITVSPATTTEYTVTYTSGSCGSASYTATVTVGTSSASAMTQNICSGSSYTFGGRTLTTAGTYYDTLSNASGCDSIITLTLTVTPNSTTSISQAICSGQSYTFAGQTLTTAGTYYDTLTAVSGCDSIIILTLTVIPNSTTAISQTICNGQSYTFGGQVLTTAGTYRDTVSGGAGCDSITVLTLSVIPIQTTPVSQGICSGSSITFGGQTITTAGTYSDTLTGIQGCDSIVVLTVAILQPTSGSFSQSVCQGSSYTFNGQTLTASGTYTATLTNAAGCDSTVTLTLTVIPASAVSLSQSICSNGSTTFNGQTLTTAGTYTETLTNVSGCDSVVTLTLTVLPTSAAAVSQSICSGQSYNFNGQNLSTAGTYIDTLTNAAGCDSIVTLTLSVIPVQATAVSQSICSNGSYTFGGQVLTTAGTYIDTLTGAAGCDSIVTLTLTVIPTSAGAISQSICSNGSYIFGGQVLTTAGTYTDTVTNAAGCDSIVALTLTVQPSSSDTITQAICTGQSYTFGGQVLTIAGYYTDTFTNILGCDSFETLSLSVLPQPVAGFVIEPAGNPLPMGVISVQDQSTGADTILWQLNNTAISLLAGGQLPISDTGSYCIRLIARTSIGCADTSTECIYVYNSSFYMPNAFTPNGDGINDYLEVYGSRAGVKYMGIRIFDRWGEKVFESSDINFQWDGKYKGVFMEPGVYVYELDITYVNSNNIHTQGTITLIR